MLLSRTRHDVRSALAPAMLAADQLRASADPRAQRSAATVLRAEDLLGVRNWLAGEHLSLGDFAGAAHLSVIDYFGDVPWRDFPLTKTWYTRLKCRPCFRPLLTDRWPGMAPAADYDNLDF